GSLSHAVPSRFALVFAIQGSLLCRLLPFRFPALLQFSDVLGLLGIDNHVELNACHHRADTYLGATHLLLRPRIPSALAI
ncbi:uncharacterized protein EV420DRAFT_1575921, partial [Desarmillaria tabescens]